MLPRSLQIVCAISLATNCLGFQVEPFEKEYEENHRRIATQPSIDSPSLSLESIDKKNAQEAFRIEPFYELQPIALLLRVSPPARLFLCATHPVRDKSPPGTPA